MRHLSEEELVLYYYGETESPEAERRHLKGCESCRSELEALSQSLGELTADPVPERPEDYGQRVWRRMENDLKSPKPRWSWLDRLRPRPLAWAGAAVVLLVAAFVAGRLSFQRSLEPERPSAAEIREGVLLVALSDHLESTQILLMEIVNAPAPSERTAEAIDISYERRLAEDLVDQNRLYRQTADQTGEKVLASVLDELERMLVEIAHSPERMDWNDFDDLRRRIEANGVLFKVRVLNVNVRERQIEKVTQKKL